MKFIKYFLLLIIILLVAGFLYLNTIFKTAAENIASSMTGTKVSMTYASISPFSGNITMGGLDVGNPAGYQSKNAIEFSSISASVDMKSIFTDTIKIKKIELKNPIIYYEIGLKGDNIRALLSNVTSSKGSGMHTTKTDAPESASKKKVIIQDLYLYNCKAKLMADLFGLKAGQEIDLSNIHLQNIGGENDGTSIENVTGLVLQDVIKQLAKIRLSDVTTQLKNINGKSIGKSLKSLF